MNQTPTYNDPSLITQPVKKPRKPRTKKADMIKKKLEMEKLKETQIPKKRGRKPREEKS